MVKKGHVMAQWKHKLPNGADVKEAVLLLASPWTSDLILYKR